MVRSYGKPAVMDEAMKRKDGGEVKVVGKKAGGRLDRNAGGKITKSWNPAKEHTSDTGARPTYTPGTKVVPEAADKTVRHRARGGGASDKNPFSSAKGGGSGSDKTPFSSAKGGA